MRIIHYVNQFFGQIGGEEKADYPLEVVKGPVGAGLQLNKLLEGDGEVVATIICGDNYFAENTDTLTTRIIEILKEEKAELLVAGPAFTAGRYGLACGSVCKIAHQSLGIFTVSGMNEENPGLDMFRKYAYILPTANNARGMNEAIAKIGDFVRKIARGETIGSPEQEGYFKRGIRVPVFREEIGAKRAVEMLLKKLKGEEFETELEMPIFSKCKPSAPVKDMKNATIALMTSGGIVPKGNPDHLEACFCSKYKYYSIEDFGGEGIPNAEVCHGGFDPTYANENANRVLPVDAMIELERSGEIGNFYERIYVTSGNAMAADQAETFGDNIAQELLSHGEVDAVILTST